MRNQSCECSGLTGLFSDIRTTLKGTRNFTDLMGATKNRLHMREIDCHHHHHRSELFTRLTQASGMMKGETKNTRASPAIRHMIS